MKKNDTTKDVTLSYGECMVAKEEAQAVYMAAIIDAGRDFKIEELDACIEFYIEAAKNVRFLGLHGYRR